MAFLIRCLRPQYLRSKEKSPPHETLTRPRSCLGLLFFFAFAFFLFLFFKYRHCSGYPLLNFFASRSSSRIPGTSIQSRKSWQGWKGYLDMAWLRPCKEQLITSLYAIAHFFYYGDFNLENAFPLSYLQFQGLLMRGEEREGRNESSNVSSYYFPLTKSSKAQAQCFPNTTVVCSVCFLVFLHGIFWYLSAVLETF